MDHENSGGTNWRERAERAKAQLRERDERLAMVLEENARLAREHAAVHEWNMKLVQEHYDLGDKFREREREVERLREAHEKMIEMAAARVWHVCGIRALADHESHEMRCDLAALLPRRPAPDE